MKGNNSLTLNAATLTEMIQHYFDTVEFREGRSPKVLSVRHRPGPGPEFDVEFEERVAELRMTDAIGVQAPDVGTDPNPCARPRITDCTDRGPFGYR